MGLTVGTALTIANRDDLVYACEGPAENGKFAGWISMPNGRPLLNTEHIFDSPKLAEDHMRDVREQCIQHFESQLTD